MTIGEAIADFREAVPCSVDDHILLKWLAELEKTAISEIFLTHVDAPKRALSYKPYIFSDKRDTVLLIEEPFCHLYTEYLAMKYYITICDVQRYNTYAELFFNSYGNFADAYNREHRPIVKTKKFSLAEVTE